MPAPTFDAKPALKDIELHTGILSGRFWLHSLLKGLRQIRLAVHTYLISVAVKVVQVGCSTQYEGMIRSCPDAYTFPMTLDIASPCRGICKIDEPTQLCSGCLRNIDEITRWRRMDDDQKLAVLSACLDRQPTLDAGPDNTACSNTVMAPDNPELKTPDYD